MLRESVLYATFHEPILETDEAFFRALLAADVAALEGVLADDFLLIDVMQGSEVPRAALLEAVGSGLLQFQTIERVETWVRRYGHAAVVTGRTLLRGRFGGDAFTTHSRYTHVFIERRNRWQLASAQGTPVAEAAA